MPAFVDQTPSDNLHVDALADDVIANYRGGRAVRLRGRFASTPAAVTVRVAGAPFPCYSGTSGQGYSPKAKSPTILDCALPALPIGGPYDLEVAQVVRGSLQTVTLSECIFAQQASWSSKTLALRRILPPTWRLGYRDLDLIPVKQSVELTMASRLRYSVLGTGDGSTTTFMLPVAAVSPVDVRWDGVDQTYQAGFVTFTAPATISFSTPPPIGVVVSALYWAA